MYVVVYGYSIILNSLIPLVYCGVMEKITLSISKADKDKMIKISEINCRTLSGQLSYWLAHDDTEIDGE